MMRIATISFDRCDEPVDWDQTDIFGLQEAVMIALDRRFGSYEKAAAAQEEYRRVRADIESDDAKLFGLQEAWRAGLAAQPQASEWEKFEREATGQITPYCFSIKFTA